MGTEPASRRATATLSTPCNHAVQHLQHLQTATGVHQGSLRYRLLQAPRLAGSQEVGMQRRAALWVERSEAGAALPHGVDAGVDHEHEGRQARCKDAWVGVGWAKA